MWEEEFDLNSVRLCFQASFTQPTGERVQLTPVVSQPIYDNSECGRRTTMRPLSPPNRRGKGSTSSGAAGAPVQSAG